MLVGIMSDSHGDARITGRAVALLESRGAATLFHCGDLCDLKVLDELAGHDAVFVWGNCDAPAPAARRYVEKIGLTWPQPPVVRRVAGRSIAVWHGHEPGFRETRRAPTTDYVFYGHTHEYADARDNGCRFINPGALHRAAFHTVALLDVAADRLQFIQVETGETVA